jgi:hypothetical protein
MEVRDGFIVSIFNYCDRWCEACAFTSRCRLFADVARIEASLDPNLRPVTEAPPLPQDVPPPPPKWMEAIIEEMNEIARRPPTKDALADVEPPLLPEHAAIRARSMAYCLGVHYWLRDRDEARQRRLALSERSESKEPDLSERSASTRPTDPIAVISWFAWLNASKIERALAGLAEDDGDRAFPPDHEGSAKVAMIGIERSQAAWLELMAGGAVTESQAQPFLAELAWLGPQLEKAFPLARAFVRPGFDEPDDVAALGDGPERA